MDYSYDLRLSGCTEHLQSNMQFFIIPNKDLDPLIFDWIDVSECDLSEGESQECNNNIREGTEQCDKDDDEACPDECNSDCTCPPGGSQGCDNDGVREGTEECDGADDEACPGRCNYDCTCLDHVPACPDGVKEGAEECDGTADDKCPGRCNFDCTCLDYDPVCNDGVREGTEQCDKDDAKDCPGRCDNNCKCIEEECEIYYNNMTIIDIDGDGICKGLDCNDYEWGIQVIKEDSECTKERLCSNKEWDWLTLEKLGEIDCGGLCDPCKINIALEQPKNGVSLKSPFDLVVLTDYNAECRFELDRKDLDYGNMLPFGTSGGKTHTKTGFVLNDGNEHKLYVKCDDGHMDPDKNTLGEFDLSVDSSKPVILEYAGL